jgi:Ni/Co efflux regulator RcnB
MIKKLLIPVLIAASFSSMAVAQDRNNDRDRNDRNRGDNMQRGHDNDRSRDDRGDFRGDNRRDDRHDNRFNDHRDDRSRMAHYRGAGPRHDLQRGGRLPTQYRNRQYVVNDWRGHHLSAPPRGHQWVQTGSDYVLVAAATGLIAQIFLNQ